MPIPRPLTIGEGLLRIRDPTPLLGILIKDLDRRAFGRRLDDAFDLDVVDGRKESAFTHGLAFGEIQPRERAGQAIGAIGDADRLLRDPRMLQAFFNGNPRFHVGSEHAVDEIERRVSDAVPVRARVIEAAGLDLLTKRVRVLFGTQFIRERWEAAEADVEDDAEGPDVHGAGVAALFGVFEDFRGDVGGGAAEGAGEGVFADDFGEPEVGEFDV